MQGSTSPQTFQPSIWQPLGKCLWSGTHLVISSPGGLGILIVLVKSVTSHGVVNCLWSAPWAPVHLGHISSVAPYSAQVNTCLYAIFIVILSSILTGVPFPSHASLWGLQCASHTINLTMLSQNFKNASMEVFAVVPCCLCNSCTCTC